MSARRASLTAVVAVAGATLLLAMLVVWSASIGPSRVLTGHGPPRPTATYSNVLPPIATLQSGGDFKRAQQRPARHSVVLTLIGDALAVAMITGILGVVLSGARRARDAWRNRRLPPPPPERVTFDLLEADEELVQTMADDAPAQRQLLLGGVPRNAVVAAWSRFEEQAARAGLGRQRWETSTEFTLRLLEHVHADDQSVRRLASLYHRARFSTHELGEDERAAAIAALDAVHASMVQRRVPR